MNGAARFSRTGKQGPIRRLHRHFRRHGINCHRAGGRAFVTCAVGTGNRYRVIAIRQRRQIPISQCPGAIAVIGGHIVVAAHGNHDAGVRIVHGAGQFRGAVVGDDRIQGHYRRCGVVQVFIHDRGDRVARVPRRITGGDAHFRAVRQRRIRSHTPVAITVRFHRIVGRTVAVHIHINGATRFGGTGECCSIGGVHRRCRRRGGIHIQFERRARIRGITRRIRGRRREAVVAFGQFGRRRKAPVAAAVGGSRTDLRAVLEDRHRAARFRRTGQGRRGVVGAATGQHRIGAWRHIVHHFRDGRGRRWRGVVQVFIHDRGDRIAGITRRIRGRYRHFRFVGQGGIRCHRPVTVSIRFHRVVRGAIAVGVHFNGTARFRCTRQYRAVGRLHRDLRSRGIHGQIEGGARVGYIVRFIRRRGGEAVIAIRQSRWCEAPVTTGIGGGAADLRAVLEDRHCTARFRRTGQGRRGVVGAATGH